jgi:hypothetical protein
MSILLAENESLKRQLSLLQQQLDRQRIAEDSSIIDKNVFQTLYVANRKTIEDQQKEIMHIKEQLRDAKEAYTKLEEHISGLRTAWKEAEMIKNSLVLALESKLEELRSCGQKTLPKQESMDPIGSKTDASDSTTIVSDDESLFTENSDDPCSPPRSITDGDHSSLDVVLSDAIRLNGGQELSPQLVQMWQMMCTRSESMYRIDEQGEEDITEDTSYDVDFQTQYIQSYNTERKSLELPVLEEQDTSRPRYDRDISDLSMTLALSARWKTENFLCDNERPAYDRNISDLSLPMLQLTRTGSHTSVGLEPVRGLPARKSLRLPICPEGGPAAF